MSEVPPCCRNMYSSLSLPFLFLFYCCGLFLMSLLFFSFLFFLQSCFFDDDDGFFWRKQRTKKKREIFLDREFSKLEFLHKKERDVYIKDELFFF